MSRMYSWLAKAKQWAAFAAMRWLDRKPKAKPEQVTMQAPGQDGVSLGAIRESLQAATIRFEDLKPGALGRHIKGRPWVRPRDSKPWDE